VEHAFVAWLRPPADNVTVLVGGAGRCGPATVNKHLAALFSFYDWQALNGVVLAQSLVAWRRVNRGGYRPFLQHVTGGRPVATRPLRVRQSRRLPRTLTEEQLLTLVEACEHLRDRFLLLLMAETAMRSGQALGLRHADFVSHRRELRIVPRRDNANGARAKTFEEHLLPGPVSRMLRRRFQRRNDQRLNLFNGELGGRADRGSSTRPSNRDSTNRDRHFPDRWHRNPGAPRLAAGRTASARRPGHELDRSRRVSKPSVVWCPIGHVRQPEGLSLVRARSNLRRVVVRCWRACPACYGPPAASRPASARAHASGGHVSVSAEKDGNSPVSHRVRGAENLRPGRAARPAPSPTTHGGPATVLDLQRVAGNKAVAALLDRSAHPPDAAVVRADPLAVQKAPPTNAALQDQINALELRTKALEGRQKATTQDLLWRGQFGDKMSSWKQAILRITGGLDAAQVGFTTAQAKQAEFDALVKQLPLAAVTVGFAAGFEPLLSSQLMASKIGATADEIAVEVKRVGAIVEKVENPAVAAVSTVPNIVGALPKTSTQPPSAPVAPGSTAVGYLAANLGQVESHSQAIEQAFTLRATSLAALSDKDAAGINTAPQEAICKGLFESWTRLRWGSKR